MNKFRGFTMVELMVVIAIVAIMITLAAPSFKNLIQSNAMSSTVNTFMADLRYARSEAIRRGGGVVMCRSNAPEATNPACGTGDGIDLDGDGLGDGWVSGWFVFHDLNNDGGWDAGEPVLRVQSSIKSIDSIMKGGTGSTIYRFTSTGRLRNLSSGAATLTFGGINFASELQRVVCVNIGGRARISPTASCP